MMPHKYQLICDKKPHTTKTYFRTNLSTYTGQNSIDYLVIYPIMPRWASPADQCPLILFCSPFV